MQLAAGEAEDLYILVDVVANILYERLLDTYRIVEGGGVPGGITAALTDTRPEAPSAAPGSVDEILEMVGEPAGGWRWEDVAGISAVIEKLRALDPDPVLAPSVTLRALQIAKDVGAFLPADQSRWRGHSRGTRTGR